jgi:hypothetical protein
VSKIVLKFPQEVIFRTRNYGTLLLAFLFLVIVFWKSLSTWSLAANLDDLGVSYSLPASQVEEIEVEIFSSNEGSRKVNVGKSSIAFSSRSVLITFKSSESSREVTQDRPKLLLSFSLLPSALYTEPSRSSPHHGQFFRPLNLIIISVVTERRRDATPSSFSATVLTALRSHGLTIVEFRVVYTRYPDG